MNKVKIFAISRYLISSTLAAAAVLALAACAPVVEPAGGPFPPSTGKGTLTIQLGVDDLRAVPSAIAARTLLPAVPLLFSSYDLAFTPQGGGEPVMKNGITSLTEIELDPGTYTLVLKAYSGTDVAAEGTVSGVEVTEGENTQATVSLLFKPTETEATGTLSVTVTNSSVLTLSQAVFNWTPLSGGTGAGSESLTGSGLSGSKVLKAGYYLVTVTLSAGDRTAKRSDAAHIGAGQTTPLTWDFIAGDFSTDVTAMWIVEKNESTWGTPDDNNKLEENADGTFGWEGSLTTGSFRFYLNDENDPDYFQPAADNTAINPGTGALMIFASGDTVTKTAWSLGGAGYYRFAVNPLAQNVTVTKPIIIDSVAITGEDEEVIAEIDLDQGEDYQFAAVLEGHNTDLAQVSWTISEGLKAGTGISTDGKLTIADNETVNTDITVTATVNNADDNTPKRASVTVTVVSKTALPLSVPTNVALNAAGVATWDAPSGGETNVVSYSVHLHKGGSPMGTAQGVTKGGTYSVDFLSAMRTGGVGSYTVKVKAIGDGTDYKNSLEVTSGPQTVSARAAAESLAWVETSKAQWNNVTGASDYTVQLYKGESAIGEPATVTGSNETVTVHDFTSAIIAAGTGSYTFRVVTKGDGALILDSPAAVSGAYSYIAALPAPGKPGLSTGVVTWNEVSDAVSYTVKLYKTGTTDAIKEYANQTAVTGGSGLSVLEEMRKAAGTYTVKVTALGNGTAWLSSPESAASDPETVSALAAPSGLAWDGGSAKWDTVSGAASYTVKLYKGNELADTVTNAASLLDLSDNLNGPGSYTFTVQAIASTSTLYIDGAVSGASSAKVVASTGTVSTITLTVPDNWSGTLGVTGDTPASISRSNGSLTISVSDGDFTSYVWILDGEVLTGQTGSSITLESKSGSWLKLGGHSVTVYATKTGGGAPWSPANPITFTVTAN